MPKFKIIRFGDADCNCQPKLFDSSQDAIDAARQEAMNMKSEEEYAWPGLELTERNNIVVLSDGSEYFAAWYIAKEPETQIEELKLLTECARIGLWDYCAHLEDQYSCEKYLDKIQDILNKIK